MSEKLDQASSVTDLLDVASRTFGDRPALIHGDVVLTYRQVEDASKRIAQQLGARGVRPGDRVAIMLPNCSQFITGVHAIWRLGASAIPLNPSYQRDELARYLIGFEARSALVADDKAGIVSEILRAGGSAFHVLLQSRIAEIERDGAATHVRAKTDLEQPALFQFSSGTTGQSKKISRNHRQLLAEAASLAKGMELSSSDRIAAAAPLFHSYGFGACILAPFFAGATVVLANEHGLELWKVIERHRATVLPGVPFMYGFAGDSTDMRVDLSALRLCLSAGSPLPKATFEGFLARYGIPIRQQYGATELGATTLNRSEDACASWESIGQALEGIDIRVLDEDGATLPDGATGELAVRSPAMAEAYLDTPEDVNRRSFRDGYFLTGDLGRRGSDDNLYLVGRKKKFINAATHKVDPAEVEAVLGLHDAVAEVIVVGIPGVYGNEIVKAVVVKRKHVETSELFAYCKERIAEYKVPSLIEFRDEIPRNQLGKVMRKYLVEGSSAAQDPDNLPLGVDVVRPRLQALIKDLQSIDQVDSNLRLKDLGFSSVASISLAARITDSFGVKVPLPIFFSNCTIDSLASTISELTRSHLQGAGVATVAVKPRESDGSWPLSYPQETFWNWDYAGGRPGTQFWNISDCLRIRGPLNADALEAALAQVIERHESLRSTFDEVDGEVRQWVHPPGSFRLARERLAAANEATRWPDAPLSESHDRLFDTRRAPPLRATLFELSDADHILQLTAHHVICDAASSRLLLSEMGALYAARVHGKSSPLLPSPAKFVDHAVWQRNNLKPESMTSQLDYWRSVLRGVEPIRFRGKERRADGEDHHADLMIARADTVALTELLPDIQITTYMAMVATLFVLLSKLCHNRDLVVTVPFSDRPSAFANVYGNFIDRFFVRVNVGDDPTFLEVLARVRDSLLRGMTEFVPATLMFHALGLEEHEFAVTPVVAMSQPPLPPFVALDELPVEPRVIVKRKTVDGLFVQFREMPHYTSVHFIASANHFTQQEVEATSRAFGTLVREIMARPQEKLSALRSALD